MMTTGTTSIGRLQRDHGARQDMTGHGSSSLLLFFSSLFSFFSLFLSLLFSLSLSLSSLSTPSLPLIAISQLSDYRNFPIITQCHCVMTPNPV
ncbi:hypothetical protein M430DRAFT_210792 [Amorphotheca resinae ATCC 22711]|uniref:Uncharacterized protein n=1 Tax=Amorphotheca resinae ATCC 22711 TaxID=857342 RepID=A0A2T3B7N4_AMORE|nr:hypothetical protein M430DRAFT_210792 [Amorphotheca resinae ATCC 22711]PSS22894.1 hypothetical protein M430DRAFT_210792 [Amorphotheca resinae ATCC 22711]